MDLARDFDFASVQTRKDGTSVWTKRSHPHLVIWLTVASDGIATLTWELSLGEMIADKGWESSTSDELQLFVFPKSEQSGPLNSDWLSSALKAITDDLHSMDLSMG